MVADLETPEAFLRAIFDAPDDDTPRLVYADWLEEQGRGEYAELIRVECRHARARGGMFERGHLLAEIFNLKRRLGVSFNVPTPRGFRECAILVSSAGAVLDSDRFRRVSVERHPEWFGATAVRIESGRIADGRIFDTLLSASATQRLTELELNGAHDDATDEGFAPTEDTYLPVSDIMVRPVINLPGVDALANHPFARRLRVLNLTNNELDNDAARLLIRSPYLGRLVRLELLEGNRLRGRTWQQLRDRFGEDVMC